MLIKLPLGHCGLNVQCRCACSGAAEHTCFSLGSPKLRGYCPTCFEHKFVDPARKVVSELHHAYHEEMTRIEGWRIRNEGSYAKWAALERPTEGIRRAHRDEEVY